MDRMRRGLLVSFAGAAASSCTSAARAAGAPILAEHPMVARVWHGRTPLDKADAYRQYLFDAGIAKIASLPGNRGVQMMVSKTAEVGDFTVISFWNSVDAIRAVAVRFESEGLAGSAGL